MSTNGKKFPQKILFIGTYAGKDYLSVLHQQSYYIQMAANQTEAYYITELAKYVAQLDVISALVTVPYPHGKKLYVKRNQETNGNCKIENVSFINFPVISVASQTIAMQTSIRKWMKKNQTDEGLLVVIYAMRIPFLKCSKVIKKYIPDAVIVNVVPDLPLYTRMYDKSLTGRIITYFNQRMTARLQKHVDGFVLYAEKMKDVLKCKEDHWIVVEGLFDKRKNQNFDTGSKRKDQQIVLYAGSLEEQYGLSLLVEGFLRAKLPNTSLHLYGEGNYIKEIIKYSQECPNIRYCGMVPPEEVRRNMYQADLLVNPRPSREAFTKFSCPSKTLEYMSTGKPVMMTRLGGVPEEYFQYIYAVEDETAAGFAKELIQFFQLPKESREERAKKGQQFIYEKKDVGIQIKRVLEFSHMLRQLQDDK